MIDLTDKIKLKNDLSSNVSNLQYLVSIGSDDVIYISTNKQMFNQGTYYEDLDLKVGKIKEKIDLKTKKIQLSSMSVTITNFLTENGRFSDRLINPLGENIDIYLKTQSCETLDDCIQVAKLKITRYDHDSKTVKINADDVSLETFYLDLPRAEFELSKDINTFEHYDTKRIPILYGHLENAPAIIKLDGDLGTESYFDNNGIKLLCDSSYVDPNIDIEGIKEDVSYYSNNIRREYELMENPNVVGVKMGDSIANIHRLPFYNARQDIPTIHNYPQWEWNMDNIQINTSTFIGVNIPPVWENENTPEEQIITQTNFSNSGAMWCHAISKSTSQTALTYVYQSRNGNKNYWIDNHSDGVSMDNITTGYLPPVNDDNEQAWNCGLQSFDFENNVSGVSEYESETTGETLPSDVHLLGNVKILQNSADNNTHVTNYLKITSAYAPYHHDHFANTLGDANDKTGENTYFNMRGQYHESDNHYFSDVWRLMNQWRRNQFSIRGVQNNLDYYRYLQYLGNPFFEGMGTAAGNTFSSGFEETVPPASYPILDATKVTLYYFIDDDGGDFSFPDSTSPAEAINIKAEWDDIKLRKTWLNDDMWAKDYFVNARGRTGDLETNVKTISGEIIIYHEGITNPDFVSEGGNGSSKENLYLTELNKYLTDKELQTKYVDQNTYQIMLESDIMGVKTYLYDIDLSNINTSENLEDYVEFNFPQIGDDYDAAVEHDFGWVMNVKGKLFGEPVQPFGGWEEWADNKYLLGFNLVYGKKIYNENQELVEIQTIDSPELNKFNDTNGFYPDWLETQQGSLVFAGSGYCSLRWNEANEDEAKKLIEKPTEIIKHILDKEMIESSAVLDEEKYSNAFLSDMDNKFAFSISETENSKDILEKICEQSRLMFRYRPRDGMAVLDAIKDTYTDEDVDYTIKSNNMLKYSFTKSKIEDLCIGGCRVKYEYDYGKEDLVKTTEDSMFALLDVNHQEILDDYKNYYGIEDESNYEMEIETPYIQDKATALKFRDFMFHQYKNQHLIVKFTMSVNDTIQLEVGDIINFDYNPSETAPYGKDITKEYVILEDQRIFPYFMITNISKNLHKTDIECYQLHELTRYVPSEPRLPIVGEKPKPQPTGDIV